MLGILEELEEQKVVTVWLECSEHWRGIKGNEVEEVGERQGPVAQGRV